MAHLHHAKSVTVHRSFPARVCRVADKGVAGSQATACHYLGQKIAVKERSTDY